MIKKDIGRNDPCPCGSGKKYKYCCLGRENAGPSDPPTTNPATSEFFDQMHREIGDRKFASLEELNAFVADFSKRRNQAPVDDFHGLSSDQMHHMLDFPFDSPQVVSFPDRLRTPPDSPMATLFNLMVEAIGDQGLKATAKGNLPRKFCRDNAQGYYVERSRLRMMRVCGIVKEEDFFELHVTRRVAELAGLIRKYKGHFILSRDCRGLLADGGMSAVYPRLFRAYARNYNWAYGDRYPIISFIQQSFLFSLYLLTRYGGDWRPQSFYGDCFLRAFPMVLDGLPADAFFDPEKMIRSCFRLRVLEHFAWFLGLALMEPIDKNDPILGEYRIKKLPLLNEIVEFHASV